MPGSKLGSYAITNYWDMKKLIGDSEIIVRIYSSKITYETKYSSRRYVDGTEQKEAD